MKLKLKDVQNNPFRDLKGNPLIEAKIEELINSIEISGYWDNCIAVKREGKYCLAYGHHRLEAAKRAGLTEADFIIKSLDDAMLIKVMDLENRETYASSPASMIESVKAVVGALAEGSIPAFEVDQKTKKDDLRYAPSYVPTGDCPAKYNDSSDPSKAYTAIAIARFLGRAVRASGNGQGNDALYEKPATAVKAALDFLQLRELGKINSSVLTKDGQPITATKLAVITSEIKQRHVAEVVRRGKTQAELNVLREKQLAAQAKAKADEKAAEDARKALLKKEADARRAENEQKADDLAAKRKDADERAKAKEELNKLRMAELEEKIAQKKSWEAEQCIQDAYLSIRRDVEAAMRRLENIVSEHNPFREEVKSLAKLRKLKAEDRERLRQAALSAGEWYKGWVATQFLPLVTEVQELAEMSKKEKAKQAKESK